MSKADPPDRSRRLRVESRCRRRATAVAAEKAEAVAGVQ